MQRIFRLIAAPLAAAEISRVSPVRCFPNARRCERWRLELPGEHDPKHQ
jgi:hypothetical protein